MIKIPIYIREYLENIKMIEDDTLRTLMIDFKEYCNYLLDNELITDFYKDFDICIDKYIEHYTKTKEWFNEVDLND